MRIGGSDIIRYLTRTLGFTLESMVIGVLFVPSDIIRYNLHADLVNHVRIGNVPSLMNCVTLISVITSDVIRPKGGISGDGSKKNDVCVTPFIGLGP